MDLDYPTEQNCVQKLLRSHLELVLDFEGMRSSIRAVQKLLGSPFSVSLAFEGMRGGI